jgi:hypothetical protein
MGLVEIAHISSSQCVLLVKNEHVNVIVDVIIDECIFGRIKLIQVKADILKTI